MSSTADEINISESALNALQEKIMKLTPEGSYDRCTRFFRSLKIFPFWKICLIQILLRGRGIKVQPIAGENQGSATGRATRVSSTRRKI